MPKKTKIIFIATFITIGIIILVLLLFFKNSSKKNKGGEINSNQPFNSFKTGNKSLSGNKTRIVNENSGINWTNQIQNQPSKFYQITNFAVAGAGFFEENKPQQNIVSSSISEKIPELRYVKRSTGHIYQMNLNTKAVTEISNSTIPGIHKVLFNSSGKIFIYRYFSVENKAIASFLTSLGAEKGNFLPFNIINVSLSPDKNSFFYLIKDSDGVVGYIKSFDNLKTTQVFNSPFSEWSSQWVSLNKIFLTTKPSWRVNGSVFSLNIKNQTLTKIFGGVEGLTTLANGDGSYILYGNSSEIGPRLWILNTKNHTTKDLDSYGLPEKCIWANNSNIYIYCAVPNTIIGKNYPDSWYQGLVSFTDYFVKINIQTLKRDTLANSINETSVDATHLFLNKNGTKLFFINKKDSTLWSLSL